jgi:hypothetical protein
MSADPSLTQVGSSISGHGFQITRASGEQFSNGTNTEVMNGAIDFTGPLTLLSQLLLGVNDTGNLSPSSLRPVGRILSEQIKRTVAGYDPVDFGETWGLASSNHVILRAFPVLYQVMKEQGSDRVEWIQRAMEKEQSRIDHALSFLTPICESLGEAGDAIVIKSLDHWPDLGSDLDLYTNAPNADVVAIMARRFNAQLAERSWGDRLAKKWNFIIPGLPELVEVHVSRLGQTGEQVEIAASLAKRSRCASFGTRTFRVPAPEERLLISTLQRMYRHFYMRLCDVVDTAALLDSGTVDYSYLHSLARSAGLWDGLAAYLVTVAGYVKSFRGTAPSLPDFVANAAQFGNELVRYERQFLRVPIFPQAARLYASEWKRLLFSGQLESTLRLSLLPGLAVAAALDQKLTGSDKGVW